MEPFSTNFRDPIGYSIPALAYGTQLCEETPQCCIPGIDYRHFYDELECPRVLMNVSVHNYVCVCVCVCIVNSVICMYIFVLVCVRIGHK